jgi:hypothetical protein
MIIVSLGVGLRSVAKQAEILTERNRNFEFLPVRQLDLSAIHSEHAITELSSTIGLGPEIAEPIQGTLTIIAGSNR